jgi:glycosyltransferase involved in cell wall biosynthesis
MHAVSTDVKERMVADGYAAEQIHVLHSPAPPTQSSISPPPELGTPRFLFLGRIVPEKGLAPLLRALSSVSVPIHLDVAGDGYQKPSMEALCQRLGLNDRVTFHGWADPDQVERLMTHARAVVFPSIWNEPAGLISLEAAAAGRPIIASRAGGIPEYATEDYAVLVPPGSVSALAAAISRLATDYDEAARLGRSGREVVTKRFSLTAFLSGLDAIYDTVRETSASLPVP